MWKSSTLLTNLLRMFIPLECPICGGIPVDGAANMLCAECFSKIKFLKPPFCPGCGGELTGILEQCPECLAAGKRPWVQAFSVFLMDGFLRDLIHSYKYHSNPELARALGDIAADQLKDRLPHLDLIVPTPLHWTRLFMRGYNQAELLAERLSLRLGVPCDNVLIRKRRTKQQAKLKRNERKANLSKAFFVPDVTKVKKRAILLVDDVITTGSTLSAAAAALRKAGAGHVYVCSAARRQRN